MYKFFAVILFFIVVVPNSLAQDVSTRQLDDHILLQEVVITGTGTEHYVKDAPVKTEVITRKALENFQGRDLSDILGSLSSSISFNPSDMGSGIQMGGLGNSYILILVDGKRLNGAASEQVDLNMINVDNIERIEIVKGAASSLYGSDAIAGVINIITRRNFDNMGITNSSRVGGYGDLRQSNVVGFKLGKFNFQTSGSYTQTDGWQNTDKELYHYEIRDSSVTKTVNKSHNYTVAQKVNYAVNEKLSFSADGSYYSKKNFRPHGPYRYYTYNQTYSNFGFGLGSRLKLKDDDYLTVDLTYGRNDFYYDYIHQETTDFFDKETGLRIIRYPGEHILETTQDQFLAMGKGVFHLNEKHTINTGIEYSYNNLFAPRRIENGSASVYSVSVYGQDEWDITDNLNITLGVNLSLHKTFKANISPKLSIMQKLGDFNLRATYSRGYKTPTIKQLYDDYITSLGGGGLKHYYGNVDLKPQNSNYYSVGAEYNNKKFSASVSVQYNSIRNMISLVEVPMSPEDRLDEIDASMQYKNLSKASSFVVETDLSYAILKSLTIGLGYTYTDAQAQYIEDISSKFYMQYLPINGTSNHKAKFRVSWSHSIKRYKFNIGIFGQYQSLRHYVYDGDGAPYHLWRINTRHSILDRKRWTVNLNLGVDNIFDYVDTTPFGFHRGTTSPGRTFYVSLNIIFKNNH